MIDHDTLARFDDDGGHVCVPNPIECPTCHGDGTGKPFLGNGRGYVSDEDEDKFDRLLSDPFGRF